MIDPVIDQSFRSTWKITLGRSLPSTSSVTGWEWGEIHCGSSSKNRRRIYHTNMNYFKKCKISNKTADTEVNNPCRKKHQRQPKKLVSSKKRNNLNKLQSPIGVHLYLPISAKMNNERLESAFKILSTKFLSTSRTKSHIRMNSVMLTDWQNSFKEPNSIESIDNDTECRVASLNLEEVLNNYKTWNHLTVRKLISSLTFFKC